MLITSLYYEMRDANDAKYAQIRQRHLDAIVQSINTLYFAKESALVQSNQGITLRKTIYKSTNCKSTPLPKT
jgi:hypothetical protein